MKFAWYFLNLGHFASIYLDNYLILFSINIAHIVINQALLHIVKIPTFYLRRYGQNCPYCRKIEEIYKKKKIILPDNVALATLTSLLPR
jgi:hypothetical protein